ncbi:MAG TPA: hypothetical protein VK558_12890 [Patescibacteria group bacterium]|nr:hypothetical protein [Patescibacteria group bacterium]
MLFRTRLHALFIAVVAWGFPAHAATVLDETTLVLDGTGETLSLRHRALLS